MRARRMVELETNILFIFFTLLAYYSMHLTSSMHFHKFSSSPESSMNQPKLTDNPRQKDGLLTESHQFEFSEILSITGNFQKSIGKGGFGVVYHGYLPDTTQVAVKLLSQSSSQGAKEFQAEVKT